MGNQTVFSNKNASGITDLSRSIDVIRNRLPYLHGKDKLFMKMYFDNGCSVKQMAKLSNIHETTIYRRIKKLTKCLTSREVEVLYEHKHQISKNERRILKDHYRQGLSQRQICEKHGITRYQVRKTLKKVAEIFARK